MATTTGAGAGERLSGGGLPTLGGRAGRLRSLGAFLLYLSVVVLLEHRALAHLNSVCACTPGADPTEYMWAMVWFPHAILHGLNPLVTNVLWAGSGGFDLARSTFTPAEALIAWPVTALAGPVVGFNVLAILAPVVGAWSAYRLCLYVTGRWGASLVGGYLFGFSVYELGQMLGHLQLVVTFAIPAAVLLTLKRLDCVIGRRLYVVLMVVLLAFQLLTSTELLLTSTCLGALALGYAWLITPPQARGSIASVMRELLLAYGVMAIVCSPYLYYAFSGSGVTNGPIQADALSFFIPTWLTALGASPFLSISRNFPGNLAEQGTYLGLPLIAIVLAYVIPTRRRRATRVLVMVLAVTVVSALGDHLYINGHRTAWLPWSLFTHVPLLRLVVTVRLGVYIGLVCAVIASMWLAAPGKHRAGRWLLGALALVSLFPNVDASFPGSRLQVFTARYATPPLFATRLYRRYLRPGEIVLPLPYGSRGYSLLWQARTNMYFRLASGRFKYPPANYPQPISNELMGLAPLTADAPSLLREFLASERVSAVVADPVSAQPWLGALARLGLRPTAVGGLLVYRIPRQLR